jgi:hypothetical protein
VNRRYIFKREFIMIRFNAAATAGCCLVTFATLSAAAADPRPARGGHLIGPDTAALMTPINPRSRARGGHLLGPDAVALAKPIAPRAPKAGGAETLEAKE